VGVYLRGRWYWYKRRVEGRLYQRPVRIKKGQESMLSARVKQVDDEITATAYGLPSPSRPTKLSEYIKTYLRHKAHKKSLDRDEQRLEYIAASLPDLPLREYRPSHFEELEATLQKDGKASATVNRYMELVRHPFNLAIRDGILVANPLAHYEPFVEDGTRRALSDDEIAKVFAVLDQVKADRRFKSIRFVIRDLALFALATGMRLSEILNLQRDQVQGDLITLPISATKSRRRGTSKKRTKVIVVSALALDIIARQPETADAFVFAMRHRQPNAVFYVAKKIREKSGVEGFSFHWLRHTASTLIARWSSLRAAQMILGHEDIQTTAGYTHPDLAEQRASVTKLGDYLSDMIHN